MQKLNKAGTARNDSGGFTLIEVLVALSILALGVAGIAQLRHAAYQHIALTQEIQEASYFADTHLNQLSIEAAVDTGFLVGEYSRGAEAEAYPWTLDIQPLPDDILQPESLTLSTKVSASRVNLSVWIDQGRRELSFHMLLLASPKEREKPDPAIFSKRAVFKLGAKQ
jgi:prepilin-type N-terminal cleavage/methylation domain-containing protein